jgi:hypothetical protein
MNVMKAILRCWGDYLRDNFTRSKSLAVDMRRLRTTADLDFRLCRAREEDGWRFDEREDEELEDVSDA